MKKYIIRSLLALSIIISLICLDYVLALRTGHGIKQARYLYDQPKDTVDVVFLGSSHVHCDVNTALLWEDYGITSYDYSAAEQPLWITYYYLQEFCKTQSPKVAVLDLYSPAHFTRDFQYIWIRDNLLGFRFNLNKIKIYRAAVETKRISDFFPSFFSYHNRYEELGEKDFAELRKSKKDRQSFKGYTPYFASTAWDKQENFPEEKTPLTEKSALYLRKIIDYCKEKNIELFLVVNPYVTFWEDEMVYNYIVDLAAEEGIPFVNCNRLYDDIGIDFAYDYYDFSHLNYEGGLKYTRYLAEHFLAPYNLPDHRGDARYESYDRHAAEIRYIAENGIEEQMAVLDEKLLEEEKAAKAAEE